MDDGTEEYMLKWNSHNTEVISEFHELCREELFTDVTISVEDETFEAHKIVLSACSPYFRQMLTTATRCSHPVIFLKDVSAEHVRLLIQYMYVGQIAVRKEELTTFLKSADHLRIRGLSSPTSEQPPRNDVLIASKDEEDEDHRKIIVSTTANKGRKGYLPKKIRTSGDRISDNSSPGGHTTLSDSGASPVPQRRHSGGPLPTIMETCQTFNNNSKDDYKDDNIDSLEQEGTATTTEEEEEDQPVDFSQTSVNHNSLNNQPGGRYSILSNYLKTGKLGHKKINMEQMEDCNEAASITSKAAERLAQTWLEQSLTAMQTEDDDAKKEKRTTLPLQETLGIDIADRLRSHFLSNLPPQSYNWLNNSGSPNGKNQNSAISGSGNNVGLSRTAAATVAAANGKPAVTCEICGKKLADPSSLYRHRKIHSGDKPHKCPYCTRRFIQRYNMKQHIKTHRMERHGMSEAEKAEYLPRPRQSQDHVAVAQCL